MRAYQLEVHGTAPTLVELAQPAPAAGEVEVAISACGLNFADLLMIDGRYQEKPPLPVTLGLEAAGTVTSLGDGVGSVQIGDRVAVFAGAGGLADYGCFAAAQLVPIPDTMDFATAAGFQIAYGTSHVALDHKARLQPGERLVVTGAAGGVGLTAVEIGALMGAEVIAIARGADKLAVAKTHGATHLIDAESDDIRGQLKALGGVDVAYEAVGGDLWEACFRAANPEARLLAIGFASGEVPQIKANQLLVKNLSVMGLYWGGYLRFAPDVLGQSLRQLFDWYAEGKLKPHIGHRFPLDEADAALDLLRQRKSTGKVVVTMV